MMAVGIPGFDLIAGGGLPKGRATFVVGTAGAGKTTFALQFLAAGLRDFEEGGVLVSFEEAPEDLLRNTAAFGWDLAGAREAGRLGVVDATPALDQEPVASGAFDLDGLWAQIEHQIERTRASRLVLDSVGAIFATFTDATTVRREFFRITRALRELGVTTLITGERTQEYGPVARLEVEEFVADNVIVLRNPLDGEKRRRTIEILKYRGAPHEKGEYPFSIDPLSGIDVIPLSAIELNRPASEERASLGNEGLDGLCGGGIFRDALVLVSGATGSGKSLLGLEFVKAGLEAGESAMYVSFEESENQILRNARSWGLDLTAAVSDGRLEIRAQYPERMGLDDLLISLRKSLADSRPTRVVIDSLTALERTSSPRAFREFVSGLSSYLKATGVAGLYIDATSRLMGGPDVSDTHVSTMSDMIILLRYFEVSGELRRCIAILKMRGSEHSRELREYAIDGDGLHLGDRVPDAEGILGR